MKQNIYREPGERGSANLQAVIDRKVCGLCDDPSHTAGVAQTADGGAHVFTDHATVQRRIAAAKAVNERFAAAR